MLIRRTAIAAICLFAISPAKSEYPVNRPPRKTPAPAEGNYTIFPGQPRQVIKGLGFEIQSDSIASGNAGLPESFSSVPHDLVPAERQRFYSEMLRGFRYCRFGAGLYWRGLDADQKQFQDRWPGQLAEIREMIQQAGIEGLLFEYWSPAPYWKANRKLVGSCLRCFSKAFANDPDYHGDTARFLQDFAQACRQDLQTIRNAGIPISMWGLQNEPFASTPYSSCAYNPEQYSKTFLAVAPAIRAFDPKISIVADDANLLYIKPAMANPEAAGLIDAYTIHIGELGGDSAGVTRPVSLVSTPRPGFEDEYEYLSGPASPDRCLNTVQDIMNWFQIAKAPIWYWIHALKPIGNKEGSGYALGFWRPPDSPEPADPQFAGLQPGHWTYNPYNWNAVAGFLRHMPWDSTDVTVQEEKPDNDLRIFAFKRPDGKLVVVLSNRCGANYQFNIQSNLPGATFTGYRYTPDDAGDNSNGRPIGTMAAAAFTPQLADRTWEFWVQN